MDIYHLKLLKFWSHERELNYEDEGVTITVEVE